MLNIIDKFSKYPNIHYEKNSIYPFYQLNESTYIESVLEHVIEILGKDFYGYDFFVYSNHGPGNIPPQSVSHLSAKKKVLLFFSDEHGEDPGAFSENYHAVFKSYIGLPTEKPNVFPLAIGLVKDVPTFPTIPINERNTNVFFSGNLNLNRVGFYKSLTNWGSLFPNRLLTTEVGIKLLLNLKRDFSRYFPDSLILFNHKFKSGLTPSVYGETLSQSKVILCPRGYFSTECFRHYEALRAGCIVVSERLPDNHLYKDSPIIQIDNWDEGLKQVGKLIVDQEKMDQLHHQALDWWENVFSEKATAKYITSCLNKLLHFPGEDLQPGNREVGTARR